MFGPQRGRKKPFLTEVLIGDGSVGKSSLFNAIQSEEFKFNEETGPTCGMDLCVIDVMIENEMRQVRIWDTAGQERYKTVTNSYYRQADIVWLVFDVTRPETFKNVKDMWFPEAFELTDSKKCQFALLGNKCDIEQHRKVTRKEAEDFASQHFMPFYEVSARTGSNCKKTFMAVSEAAGIRKIKQQQIAQGEDKYIILNNETDTTRPKRKRCC